MYNREEFGDKSWLEQKVFVKGKVAGIKNN